MSSRANMIKFILSYVIIFACGSFEIKLSALNQAYHRHSFYDQATFQESVSTGLPTNNEASETARLWGNFNAYFIYS